MSRNFTRRELGLGAAALLASSLPQTGAKQQGSIRASSRFSWSVVAPGIWQITVGSPENITPIRSRLVEMKSTLLSSREPIQSCPVAEPKAVVSNRGAQVRFPLAPYEEIYGFGLQFFSVAHRGKKRMLRVNADPKGDTGDTHAPVPFYVTSLGYGIFVDTARYVIFCCGESRPKPTSTQSATESDKQPIYTSHLEPNESSEVLIEVPNCEGVDIYAFAGPTMLDVVRRYNLFSGGGVLPPEWGLGFLYRVESNARANEILQLAREFREHHIPCDVIGLEPGWHSHAYACTFEWNRRQFPNPAQFAQELDNMHFRLNLWEHAFIHPASPLFEPMVEHSADRLVWGGLVPDFQDAEARRIFGEHHRKNFLVLGISGFKLDECDNSDYTGGWSFPEMSQFPSGADGEQMHSLYGLRYQKTLWQQFEARNQPLYSLVRSSGALASPYPFVLYSDLYDHRQFIRALVNSGFCGLLWCPEVRDAKNQEDFIRRLQSVVFSPLAMINGWYIRNPPWKQLERRRNNADDFMADWQTLEERCREILGWRMQLIPYLQSAFARYALDGTPPFRALILDWPDIEDFSKTDDAWMMGDRILVAPLFAGESGRKLLLPPGEWYDYWTATRTTGSTFLDIPAATRNVPLFVKAGSVLPLARVTDSTADAARRELTVRIFGDGSIPFSLALPTGEFLNCSWDHGKKSGSLRATFKDPSFTVGEWKHHV